MYFENPFVKPEPKKNKGLEILLKIFLVAGIMASLCVIAKIVYDKYKKTFGCECDEDCENCDCKDCCDFCDDDIFDECACCCEEDDEDEDEDELDLEPEVIPEEETEAAPTDAE